MLYLTMLIFLIIQFGGLSAYNYCGGKPICKGSKHIVCEMEKEIQPLNNAKFVMHIPETTKVRKTFLEAHNNARNQLAKGDCKTNGSLSFQTASRLREVIWDKELAYIARKHSSLCKMQHSKCHGTTRFPAAGQNLGYFTSTKKKGFVAVGNGTVYDFFNEHRGAEDPDALIKDYDVTRNKGTGHFTVVVSDRVSRIGCAISICTDCTGNPKFICYFTTCQYDFTNLIGSYVYQPGEPLSKCKDWKSPGKSDKYEYLCKNMGYIFDSVSSSTERYKIFKLIKEFKKSKQLMDDHKFDSITI